MPKINQELEKLENFLEKYIETMKNKVNKSEEIDEEQQIEFQRQKQELEAKIEKAQLYLGKIKVPENRNFIDLDRPKKYWGSTEGLDKPLCERYYFEYGDDKSITLDIAKELSDKLELKSNAEEDNFYVAEEVLTRSKEKEGITIKNESEIFLKRHLIEAESNKGKVVGFFGGTGVGVAGGAAAGAGTMFLLAPYTFGLSLSFIPAAATIGAVAGGLSGATTGLTAGLIADKLSNSEIVKIKSEIKSLLEGYKTMIEKESSSCQDTEQKEYYDNEVRELNAYIENPSNWK